MIARVAQFEGINVQRYSHDKEVSAACAIP